MRLRRSSDERCERARLWASLELDGELSEVERALLDEHAASCPACRTVRVDFGAVTTAIREAPLAEPERRFRLERGARPAAARSLALRFAAAGTLAAVALGLGVFVRSLGADQPVPAPPTGDLAFLEPNGKQEFRNIRKNRGETPPPAREAPRLDGV